MHPAVITPEEIARYRPAVEHMTPTALAEAARGHAAVPSRLGQALAATCRAVRREKLGLPAPNPYTEDA